MCDMPYRQNPDKKQQQKISNMRLKVLAMLTIISSKS